LTFVFKTGPKSMITMGKEPYSHLSYNTCWVCGMDVLGGQILGIKVLKLKDWKVMMLKQSDNPFYLWVNEKLSKWGLRYEFWYLHKTD
jgi:hypothetical protein